jgi:hypothetical protein
MLYIDTVKSTKGHPVICRILEENIFGKKNDACLVEIVSYQFTPKCYQNKKYLKALPNEKEQHLIF